MHSYRFRFYFLVMSRHLLKKIYSLVLFKPFSQLRTLVNYQYFVIDFPSWVKLCMFFEVGYSCLIFRLFYFINSFLLFYFFQASFSWSTPTIANVSAKRATSWWECWPRTSSGKQFFSSSPTNRWQRLADFVFISS